MTPEDKIKQIFADPTVQQKVVDMVVSNKPVGWARRSNAPYYLEFLGKQRAKEIDKMLETRGDLVFRYDKFPDMSANSLYLYVNQSVRYLLDNLDPERKYARWHQMVRTQKVQCVGIRISFLPAFRNSDIADVQAEIVEPQEARPVWMEKIDKYVEDATPEDKPLIINGLCLTPSEIATLKESFDGVNGLMSSVTSSTVKVVKVHTPKA